jgi:hypothetical protein
MLPLHEKSKMHRHAFSNGQVAYPSTGGSGTFSIQPHKYVCRRHVQRSFTANVVDDAALSPFFALRC